MENAKPADLFIGVIDLFAILMPGALVVGALGALHVWDAAVGALPILRTETAGWIAFAVGAYVAGHFVFLVASLLDDIVYDRMARPLFRREAYPKALALKNRYFGLANTDDNKDRPMNPFAWAKTIMVLRAPVALGEVQRLEADSKFFRSLMVVAPILAWAAIPDPAHRVWMALVAIALTVAAAFRYSERRHKSTEWAYRYMITLFGAEDAPAPPDGEGARTPPSPAD